MLSFSGHPGGAEAVKLTSTILESCIVLVGSSRPLIFLLAGAGSFSILGTTISEMLTGFHRRMAQFIDNHYWR